MGIRSYLLADVGEGFMELLEANNVLPVLWIGTITKTDIGSELMVAGPSLGLGHSRAYGVTLSASAAVANLARRRVNVLHWLGAEAAEVLDQLAAFLPSDRSCRVHLDLAEWVDASNSVQEAMAELHNVIEALDTAPPGLLARKRRPKAIKWLDDHYDLNRCTEDDPEFGLVLAGTSNSLREPWRRDPPRKLRRPDDKSSWTTRDVLISSQGSVVVAASKNYEDLETPVLWSLVSGQVRAMPIPDSVDMLYAQLLSGDGQVVFGECRQYADEITYSFCYSSTGFALMPFEPGLVALTYASSNDGSVVAGAIGNGDFKNYRAYRWHAQEGVTLLVPFDVRSEATLVTPDGMFAAGTYQPTGQAPAERVQAFVWSVSEGFQTAGQPLFSLDWLAISADGQRGVLKAILVYAGADEYYFWEKGKAFRRIEDEAGNPLRSVRVSADVDVVLGTTASAEAGRTEVKLWSPNAPPRLITIPAEAATTSPVYVSNAGRELVVLLGIATEQIRADTRVVVWTESHGAREVPLVEGDAPFVCNLNHFNRSPSLASFVAAGYRRSDYHPVVWTEAKGLQLIPPAW